MGCYLRTDRGAIAADMARVFYQFSASSPTPAAAGRGLWSAASSICSQSGRALMSRPKLILFDEPSLGSPPPSSTHVR